jgi:NitT/TauT family transport system ATP-binding protein
MPRGVQCAAIDTFVRFTLPCNINEMMFHRMERSEVALLTTPAPTARSAASDAVIEAIGVNHAYEGQDGWVEALQNFEISIPRNEFLCLLGPSGCGKSSFLRIVTGLMKPMEGEVRLGGKRIEEPGLDRGIVFQEPALFPWLTALRNVAFGLEMSGMEKQALNERAEAVLKIVGLERAKHLYPFQLSGGMKHRVAVARAWALPNASVLLMDEPFSAIDAINRMTLQKYLIDAWLAEPRTVIYVTHDIDEAIYLADRIAIMTPSPGRIGQYVTIDMPRPRDRNSARATELRSELTEIMRQLGSH